jgi:hypothetical protein
LCNKYSDKEREIIEREKKEKKAIVELHHKYALCFPLSYEDKCTCIDVYTNNHMLHNSLSLSLQPTPDVGPESVAGMEVGMRCEVTLGGRRGEVCYVGEVPELSGGGHWVGVRFDEPVGKSNGSAKGKQYFECNDHHGGWVRGYKLKVGDYPEKEFNFDEDSDEDEI